MSRNREDVIKEAEALHKRIKELEGLISGYEEVKKRSGQSEERYKTFVQAIPDILYEIDREGIFTFINNAIEILGYKPGELVGKHFREIIHPDDFDGVSSAVVLQELKGKATGDEESPKLFDERRTGNRMTKNLVVRLGTKSQEQDLKKYRFSEIHSIGKWDTSADRKERKFLGSIGIIRDITERMNAEVLLQISRASFYNIVEKSSDGMIVVDSEGIIRYVNLSAERIFSRKLDELVGEPFGFPVSSGSPVEIDIMRPDGGRGIGEMREVKTEWDSEPAVLISIRDITDRKQMENKLKDTMAELENSNRDLEQFAYVASHDLQEPLRVITSYLQLIEARYKEKLDEKGSDFIERAVNGSKRMQTKIDDLLAYSRVATRADPFRKCSCEDILKSSLDNLKVAVEKSHAKVEHNPLPDLVADEAQLISVFQNLIGNGIKYCEKNKSPVIYVSAEKKNHTWQFSFKDNGIGIKSEFYNRIFEIFQRLHTREEYKGTGIGLAICKRIIDRHGGRIWVESEPNKGSTFHFIIPEIREERREE